MNPLLRLLVAATSYVLLTGQNQPQEAPQGIGSALERITRSGEHRVPLSGGRDPPAGGTSAGGAIQHLPPLGGVPRFQQRDSAQLSQRDRSCFSSSFAMPLEAIKPGTLQGPNGDDQYLAVVQHLVVGDGNRQTSGDSTDANAQLQAPAHCRPRASTST